MVKDQTSPPMEIEFRDVGFMDEMCTANSMTCKKELGNIGVRLPKKVLERTILEETGEVLYLCSWH